MALCKRFCAYMSGCNKNGRNPDFCNISITDYHGHVLFYIQRFYNHKSFTNSVLQFQHCLMLRVSAN